MIRALRGYVHLQLRAKLSWHPPRPRRQALWLVSSVKRDAVRLQLVANLLKPRASPRQRNRSSPPSRMLVPRSQRAAALLSKHRFPVVSINRLQNS